MLRVRSTTEALPLQSFEKPSALLLSEELSL